MSAAVDFTAERRLIEASADPYEVLDWIGEYRQHGYAATAAGDGALAERFEALIAFAMDQVVELKAARRRPPPGARSGPAHAARTPDPAQDAPARRVAAVQEPPVAKPPAPDPAEAQGREAARRRAEKDAAAKAADEEEARADAEELRRLQERTERAKARRDAALAETARIEAEARRAAEDAARARREQAKRAAAKEAQDAERAAAEAEAANREPARVTATIPARVPKTPTSKPTVRAVEPSVEPPTSDREELSPLAALFQERLAEVMVEPASPGQEQVPPRKIEPPVTSVARLAPAPIRSVIQKAVVPATPPPPPAPADDLPPLTGADLTSFRNWLAVSQRALAAKLGVEQSSISKGEGKPTTILAPHLRKALHLAMQEPRDAARGAS